MLFYSLQFYLFLPAAFAGYWLLRRKEWKLLFLLLASYCFYMSWSAKAIALLWAATIIDYYVVVFMMRTDSRSRRRMLLAISIVSNLTMLSVFKYANFFLQNASVIVMRLGYHYTFPIYNIILPLGISFYTFETLSYTIDCYYGTTVPFPSLRDYAFFISFFPHLIAGPIIRPRQFLPQIEKLRNLMPGDVLVGFGYFFMGLVKKLVVADRLSLYVDAVFASPQSYGSFTTWAAVIAYAMQIYCDFSGYTQMAIGLAKLFGFDLPVNFRTPYLSRNVAEFWKRWHISLSSWLRDYLYIPLRRSFGDSEWAIYSALFMTMFLGGLWHGASWTFAAWGCFHGSSLMIHRLLNQDGARLWKPLARPMPKWLRETASRVFVFLLACVGWTLFRAPTFAVSSAMLRKMLLPSFETAPYLPTFVPLLVGGMFIHDIICYLAERNSFDFEDVFLRAPAVLRFAAFAAASFLLLTFTAQQSRPFIYFQF